MLFNVISIHQQIFIILIKLKSISNKNPMLKLNIMKEKQSSIIIRIKAIHPKKLYIVLINNVSIILVN